MSRGEAVSSKHTPGPWIWGADAHDSRVMATEAPWRDRTIAEVHHGEDVMGEANGHLIAAAPDLLAACEAMLTQRYSSWHRFAEEDDPEPDDMQKARAAIKKARGEP